MHKVLQFQVQQHLLSLGFHAPCSGASLGPGHYGDANLIHDHGNAIWLGDLNYRLAMPDEDARRALRAGKLEPLLAADQLSREMAAGKVFQVSLPHHHPSLHLPTTDCVAKGLFHRIMGLNVQ